MHIVLIVCSNLPSPITHMCISLVPLRSSFSVYHSLWMTENFHTCIYLIFSLSSISYKRKLFVSLPNVFLCTWPKMRTFSSNKSEILWQIIYSLQQKKCNVSVFDLISCFFRHCQNRTIWNHITCHNAHKKNSFTTLCIYTWMKFTFATNAIFATKKFFAWI